MLSKKMLHLTVDGDVVDYHMTKNKGKVSGLVEDYLRALMGKEAEALSDNKKLIDTLKQDLVKAEVEQIQYQAMLEQKRKESQAEEIKDRERFLDSGEFFTMIKKLEGLRKRKTSYSQEAYEYEMLKLQQRTGLKREAIEAKFDAKATAMVKKAKQ